MDAEIARKLYQAAGNCGADVELDEEYSGRGMSGRTTFALTADYTDLMKCVATVAHAIDDQGQATLIDELDSLRTDNMGRRIVFY